MSMGVAADESMTWSSTVVPVNSRDSARSSADPAYGIAGCHERFERLARASSALASQGRLIRVPWDQVDDITSTISLKAKATELGLAQGDQEAARFGRKFPKS